MKFLEGVYVVGASCFCGLLYVFVASLLGVPSRSPVLPQTATDTLSVPVDARAHAHVQKPISDSGNGPGGYQRAEQLQVPNLPAPFAKTGHSGVKRYDSSDGGIIEGLPSDNDPPQEEVIYRSTSSIKYSHDLLKNSYPEIVVAVVVCGGKPQIVEQAITLIKSAILFSRQKTRLKIIGFTDDESRELFSQKFLEVLIQGQKYLHDDSTVKKLSIEIRPTGFPPENHDQWSQLYAPCSAQRLFYPTMLSGFDAVLHLDTDTIVLDDLHNLWFHFKLMNSSQYLGLVPEHELPGNGWYNKEATFPFYGARGVNAGVMLMNLTRMRQAKFQDRVVQILKDYRHKSLPWGDQDVLNIFLHNHTDAVLELPCQYNYRLNHCKCDYNDKKACRCGSAEENGVSIFHGNKGAFFKSNPQEQESLIAPALYETFRAHNLLNSTPRDLFHALSKKFREQTPASSTTTSTPSRKHGPKLKTKPVSRGSGSTPSSVCANLESMLLKNLKEYASEYEIEDHDDSDTGNVQNFNANEEQFPDFSLENRLAFIDE